MYISSLPRDVLLDILLRLPVKPLVRFSLSSKQLLSLIHHPQFISLHLTRSKSNPFPDDNFLLLCYKSSLDFKKQYCSISSFADGGKTLVEHKKFQLPFKSSHGEYGYVKIVGSANGLVCLFDNDFYSPAADIILWNMVIGKCKKLPCSRLGYRYRHSFSHMVVGFGFDLEAGDFKVVQILYDVDSDDIPDVLVYSMELNYWRKIEAVAPCYMPDRWSSNVYVNGGVHWMAYKRPRVGDLRDSIMSFDISGEVFKEMALPSNRPIGYDKLHLSASASGETLSLFFQFDDRWEVWLMQEYGVVDSWMRQVSIVGEQISLPLNLMDNGDVLLETKSGNLVSCDAENQQMKDLGISGLYFRLVPCTSSLSLLDRGEKVLFTELCEAFGAGDGFDVVVVLSGQM
ncbi:hypothetical protein RHMOL_Rhmol07G0008000 [Rhododendron molle]|uniref:Uncharacterized protein n=1 Tax=Rhododendron molle TaxID=49168 RepID=A0ACC0MXH3_RHOML|nr:hypothetical protein RHMOL_Rhmol07G0008000 [Rhododendron molle]